MAGHGPPMTVDELLAQARATLQQLGLIHATDLDGGFTAWAAAGLPVIARPEAGQDSPGNRYPGER